MPSGISKRFCRYISQDVCPWNVRFARELPEGSPFAPRHALAGKDGRTLARELLAMSQEEFSASFRKSPMKRARLRGLKRNAAVVLGNAGTVDDVDVLSRALDGEAPLPSARSGQAVRDHAKRPLGRAKHS